MIGSVKGRIRNIFFTGLLVLLPLVVSVFLFKFIFVSIDALLNPAVTKLLIALGVPIKADYLIPGLGLIATIILIFAVGLIMRNIVGRKFMELGESILIRIPVFKNIYVGAKQVIETFGSSSMAFSKVVLIEYPRKGIYALAFIAGESKGEVPRKLGKEMVNIFLPTTPNPTSGFFLFVERNNITDLDMSVEDGIKMLISAGLVTPKDLDSKLPDSAKDS